MHLTVFEDTKYAMGSSFIFLVNTRIIAFDDTIERYFFFSQGFCLVQYTVFS